MKKLIVLIICVQFMLIGCNQQTSLEQYFVDNTENKNFIQVDVSPSILNIDKTKLSADEKTAFESFDKMNVLYFKLNDINKSLFVTERTKVNAILKNPKYQQLMKFGSGKEGAQVSYVGQDDQISEFVVYGNRQESGFAIIRILGNDMNPTAILTFMSVLKNSKVNLEQLGPIKKLLE